MNCYASLMISDLLKIHRHRNSNGVTEFKYGTHLINKVEVFGTVLSVRNYEQKSIYEIDDSTGVIKCWKFHQSSTNESSVKRDLAACISSMVEEIADHYAEMELNTPKIYARGDLVLIRGKLKDFDEARSIWIDFSKILEDANWETYLILRQVQLYRRVYDYS